MPNLYDDDDAITIECRDLLRQENPFAKKEAWARLTTHYFDCVTAYARRLTGDSDKAQDVRQASFVRAYLYYKNLELPFARTLCLIVKQVSWEEARKCRMPAPPPDPLDEVSPELRLIDSLAAEKVSRLMCSLPEDSRRVLRMWADGMGHDEIGAVLQISRSGVTYRIQQALHQLKVLVKQFKTKGALNVQ